MSVQDFGIVWLDCSCEPCTVGTCADFEHERPTQKRRSLHLSHISLQNWPQWSTTRVTYAVISVVFELLHSLLNRDHVRRSSHLHLGFIDILHSARFSRLAIRIRSHAPVISVQFAGRWTGWGSSSASNDHTVESESFAYCEDRAVRSSPSSSMSSNCSNERFPPSSPNGTFECDRCDLWNPSIWTKNRSDLLVGFASLLPVLSGVSRRLLPIVVWSFHRTSPVDWSLDRGRPTAWSSANHPPHVEQRSTIIPGWISQRVESHRQDLRARCCCSMHRWHRRHCSFDIHSAGLRSKQQLLAVENEQLNADNTHVMFVEEMNVIVMDLSFLVVLLFESLDQPLSFDDTLQWTTNDFHVDQTV